MKSYFLTSLLIYIAAPSISWAEQINSKSKSDYLRDARSICESEWSKRGQLDMRMFNFCMQQQEEGYRDFVAIHQNSSEEWYSKISLPYCQNKWTNRGITNIKMMAYCLNQESEGFKDVKYYKQKYGGGVDLIVSRAILDFRSWNMAAYKVKQHFEN